MWIQLSFSVFTYIITYLSSKQTHTQAKKKPLKKHIYYFWRSLVITALNPTKQCQFQVFFVKFMPFIDWQAKKYFCKKRKLMYSAL